MASLPHLSWFFWALLPLGSLPRGLLLHPASRRAAKRPGNHSKEVQGKREERAPRRWPPALPGGSEAKPGGQGSAGAQADPEAGSQHRGRGQGHPWALPWVSRGHRAGWRIRHRTSSLFPHCPECGHPLVSAVVPGAWPPQGVVDPASAHPPAHPWPGRQAGQDFGSPLVTGLGLSPGHRTDCPDMKVPFLEPPSGAFARGSICPSIQHDLPSKCLVTPCCALVAWRWLGPLGHALGREPWRETQGDKETTRSVIFDEFWERRDCERALRVGRKVGDSGAALLPLSRGASKRFSGSEVSAEGRLGGSVAPRSVGTAPRAESTGGSSSHRPRWAGVRTPRGVPGPWASALEVQPSNRECDGVAFLT